MAYFYAQQQTIARISYGNYVLLSIRLPSVCLSRPATDSSSGEIGA